MFFSKQKNHEIKLDTSTLGNITCIIKINLVSKSKLENHFVYKCSYLDQGQLKCVSIVAKDITDIIKILNPYVNVGKSEQWINFQLGNEDVIASRIKSKLPHN